MKMTGDMGTEILRLIVGRNQASVDAAANAAPAAPASLPPAAPVTLHRLALVARCDARRSDVEGGVR